MHVVATAGHVDHGKSTLVRALTGMEPDRWAEEQRRGMTIDLGYAWAELPGGATIAFVDVPGHQRFIANMLAGVGPAPAVLFVVAADEGWSRQSAEHLAALDALGVAHGVLAITRCDLADPLAAQEESLANIADTSLGALPWVAVSAVTGAGLGELRSALALLLARLPQPPNTDRVRLWVDRSFTIRGAGTVVTGTLQAGALIAGERLALASTGQHLRVRGLETLGVAQDAVTAVSRVAVNVSGAAGKIGRGDALLTFAQWRATSEIDVRLRGRAPHSRLPRELLLHIGTAAVAVHVRPLGPDAARLTLQRPLPLQNGDRGALSNPGQQHIAAGVLILDAAPAALTRRGAAGARATALAQFDRPDANAEVARRGVVSAQLLVELGCGTVRNSDQVRRAAHWLVSIETWRRWAAALEAEIDRVHAEQPLAAGLPLDAAARAVGLPDRAVLQTLVAENDSLEISGGWVGRRGRTVQLPAAVERLLERLATTPYDALSAAELASEGLTAQALAAAERAGRIVRLPDDVVLTPEAIDAAVRAFALLPQPFELASARAALASTRRVTLAVLHHLDAAGRTHRDVELRRTVR
ncbi:MAG: SelB C-terminal domain-containing protein [Mycobacteriales bacterium]